jgi:hypothetical protein
LGHDPAHEMFPERSISMSRQRPLDGMFKRE